MPLGTATMTMTSAASAAAHLKATLTSNPQDSTEIPSLFQTFGQNDASSGDDEDVEVLGTNQAGVYGAGAYGAGHASAGRGAVAAASATRVGAYPMSASRTTGMSASLNASRNRHPLNRSTHNPYVLLSSTDNTSYGQEPASMPPQSSNAAMRSAHRFSCSNSTSQNPLMFEFNSSATTGGEFNPVSNSPGAMMNTSTGQRRQLLHPPQSQPAQLPMQPVQPMQQMPRDAVSEPADGYWRDGNPMSMSSTDVRPVATTTVGTLSLGNGGDAQNINVNVRQRVRPSASSRTSSLNTSQVALPVVQPLPRQPSSDMVDATSPLSSNPVSVSGERRPQQGNPMNTSTSKRYISVPSSAVVNIDELEEKAGSSMPELPAQQQQPQEVQQRDQFKGYHAAQQQQQQQYQQPQQQQFHPQQQQQQYYGYDGQHMAHHQQQQQAQYNGAAYPGAAAYGGIPQHHQHPGAFNGAPGTTAVGGALPPQSHHYHAQLQFQQQQQQQQALYGAAPHGQSGMSMVQNNNGNGSYVDPYGQVQPGQQPYMAVNGHAPGMMNGYGYQAVPGVSHFNGAVHVGAGFDDGRGRRGSGSRGSKQQQQQQQQMPGNAGVFASPVVSVGAKGRVTKAKNQIGSDGKPMTSQLKQVGGKSSSPLADGKTNSPTDSNGPGPSSPSSPNVGKKLAKRQDEARFHANHNAAIRLFVVVKRKMEGQRYACSLAPEEVPVGSMMLVEGDRGADLGEVLAHVSIDQMAHDCTMLERRRKAALEKLQEQKSGKKPSDAAEAEGEKVPERTGEEAFKYVTSVRDWPWLIGPATPEDLESLAPQREAEKQAFATARPIVQQFIENRYQQRVTRNEQALHVKENPEKAAAEAEAEAAEEAAAKNGNDNSSDDGDRHASLTPLTEEELYTLEMSRQVKLVDCEYQFTREKITLFVSRPSRSIFVDFRRMQRKLYRTFRCRIWIAYMDEIADDEDAPESFVFVPPPSSATAAAAPEVEA